MNKTKKIVLISIYCTLAIVFDYIKSFIPFLNMSFGGSINIALIPIVLCSFQLGTLNGILCGTLWWAVSSILGFNPYYVSLPQYCFDYFLPSVVTGVCSIFYNKKNIFELEIGIIFMMTARTFLLIISGAIFWYSGSASNSIEAWVSSFSYNFPYCFATLIMLLIVMPILLRTMKRYML